MFTDPCELYAELAKFDVPSCLIFFDNVAAMLSTAFYAATISDGRPVRQIFSSFKPLKNTPNGIRPLLLCEATYLYLVEAAKENGNKSSLHMRLVYILDNMGDKSATVCRFIAAGDAGSLWPAGSATAKAVGKCFDNARGRAKKAKKGPGAKSKERKMQKIKAAARDLCVRASKRPVSVLDVPLSIERSKPVKQANSKRKQRRNKMAEQDWIDEEMSDEDIELETGTAPSIALDIASVFEHDADPTYASDHASDDTPMPSAVGQLTEMSGDEPSLQSFCYSADSEITATSQQLFSSCSFPVKEHYEAAESHDVFVDKFAADMLPTKTAPATTMTGWSMSEEPMLPLSCEALPAWWELDQMDLYV
eukprot:TRINITY_DN14501_c0_g1_i1.p1 TRINITY_DN14501_c0_g1~~TRINITY_DN14501_c0_g1_i1.p1  ORF type:complete len:364 (-),score=73.95 TRINITY_DN14501_c0_g1_i1:109-1200(-)